MIFVVVGRIASLNKTCEKEFSSYIKCLDKNQFMFEKCKKEKEALHQSFAAVKAPE